MWLVLKVRIKWSRHINQKGKLSTHRTCKGRVLPLTQVIILRANPSWYSAHGINFRFSNQMKRLSFLNKKISSRMFNKSIRKAKTWQISRSVNHPMVSSIKFWTTFVKWRLEWNSFSRAPQRTTPGIWSVKKPPWARNNNQNRSAMFWNSRART